MLDRMVSSYFGVVAHAKNGLEAVDAVSRKMKEMSEYAMILMDNSMPVMSGPDATKAIRAAGYKGLIFGVTGNVVAEDVAAFMESGVDRVFAKPFSERLFLEALKEYQERTERGVK